MDSPATTFALYALGATALTTSLVKLKTRLELSKAKHRSLSGHSRMARRVAALVPFYDYGEERFFRADDAPDEIAARRRAGFMRLSKLYRDRYAEHRARSPPKSKTASPTCNSPTPTGCRSSSAGTCVSTFRPVRSSSRPPA